MRPLLHLGPNVITDRTFIPLLLLGSKCYYSWNFDYAWVQMLLQIRPLLHLGPVITLVPFTSVLYRQISDMNNNFAPYV